MVRWTWKVKLYTALETDLLGELRERAEEEAISVFARNLHDLLLAAPAGPGPSGPGPRPAHRLLRWPWWMARRQAAGDGATVYPHAPRNDWDGTLNTLARLCARHAVDLIAIDAGTASRGERAGWRPS